MQSFNNDFKVTSPLELMRQGEIWLDLWENAKAQQHAMLPAIYCLLSALEMYLKAYIVLKDNTFSKTQKLRQDLGHNFNKLYDKFQELTDDVELQSQLRSQLQKYKLFDHFKLDTLKYPESGRMWSMDHDLLEGHHSLDEIFKKIQLEVISGQEDWLHTKYPKSIQLGLQFQFDFTGDPKTMSYENANEFANTCSGCLPKGVIVHENYSFPWYNDPIPIRNCKACGKRFLPHKVRKLSARDDLI